MNNEKNDVQPNEPKQHVLDRFDRKILGTLTEDAKQTFAAIGQKVGLSAPAVHARITRLRNSGVISATAARLNGAA
ncbi:MAG TPA: AsnC family transcriptional regulator, partial [Woeseiaceae bacterium]|nr:AsnC family transcriptional regulator [Woeseiaceae bacterium]